MGTRLLLLLAVLILDGTGRGSTTLLTVGGLPSSDLFFPPFPLPGSKLTADRLQRNRRLEGLHRPTARTWCRLVGMNLRELDACCMQLTFRSWPVQGQGDSCGGDPCLLRRPGSCRPIGNLDASLLRRSSARDRLAWRNFLILISPDALSGGRSYADPSGRVRSDMGCTVTQLQRPT